MIPPPLGPGKQPISPGRTLRQNAFRHRTVIALRQFDRPQHRTPSEYSNRRGSQDVSDERPEARMSGRKIEGSGHGMQIRDATRRHFKVVRSPVGLPALFRGGMVSASVRDAKSLAGRDTNIHTDLTKFPIGRPIGRHVPEDILMPDLQAD